MSGPVSTLDLLAAAKRDKKDVWLENWRLVEIVADMEVWNRHGLGSGTAKLMRKLAANKTGAPGLRVWRREAAALDIEAIRSVLRQRTAA